MLNLLRKLIPTPLINCYHFCLSFLAAVLYRFPTRHIKVIGVTGTNGKSTTVELINRILEEAGYKTALLSSVRFKIRDKEWPNALRMTMPGRFFVQKFLRRAVDEGCGYAVIEVTSEGIKQHRHRFINFEAAVLTNLTPEHIEAHGGFENYKKAKGKLFEATKNTHIINIDDKNAEYFLEFPVKEQYGYGIDTKYKIQKIKYIQAENIQLNSDGINFSLKDAHFKLSLLGQFNISNALAAICVGLSQGIDFGICSRALEKFKGMPGRMELVFSKPFKVFVDYAFTPNALEKVYQTLQDTKYPEAEQARYGAGKIQDTKMICVLGSCGGGRDKWKRPVLGGLAAKYCQEVIVTNEDPYDEDPMEIINQVAQGAENISINQPNQHKSAVHKILDRREAIAAALKLAKPANIVIITGKGSEPSICIAGGKQIPWDDRRVVKEELGRLNYEIPDS